jgi:hypothetical protein
MVNKASLQQLPFLRESRRFRWRQRNQFEMLNTRFARFELGLCLVSIANRPDNTAVLGTESLLQTSGLRSFAFAGNQENGNHDG